MKAFFARKAVLAALPVLAVLTCFPARSEAAVILFSLSSEYSGATAPAGPGPWITATFSDAGPGTVTLKVAADLAPAEFVGTVLLNLDPALDASSLIAATGATSGTFAAPVINFGNDAFSSAGGSSFDIQIDFDNSPPANRFDAVDSITYTLSGIPSLSADDFSFRSVGGGKSDLLMSAHVQGIGPGANDSGWVTVPEPSFAAILAVAAAGLLRRRRPR